MERSPPKGCSPGERWARSAWECCGRRSSGRDTLAPYSLVRPRAPCPRGPNAPASPRLLPRRRRATAASPQPARSPFARLADRWKVPGCRLLPSFPEPLLSCFSPFLAIKVAAVRRRAGGPEQAQWPRAVSLAAGYLPGGGRTPRFVRSGPTFWKFSCAAASFHPEPSLRLQKIHPPFRQFSVVSLSSSALFHPLSPILERICCAIWFLIWGTGNDIGIDFSRSYGRKGESTTSFCSPCR